MISFKQHIAIVGCLLLFALREVQCQLEDNLTNLSASSGNQIQEEGTLEDIEPINQLFWKEKKSADNSNSDNLLSQSGENLSDDTECCLNGGTCVLNTFCYCRRGFHGRRCELRRRKRSCGPVAHDDFFTDGCYFCQCIDGVLTCVPSSLDCANDLDAQQGPQVFNLRKHKKRHRRKNKSRQSQNATPMNPLLAKILDSRSAASFTYHHSSILSLITLYLSISFYVL